MPKCPDCSSANTKKLSVIEKMGSSSGSYKGGNVGVGVGSGGVGVGAGKHFGETREVTDLAKEVKFKSKLGEAPDSPGLSIWGKISWTLGILSFIWGLIFGHWIIGTIVALVMVLIVGFLLDEFFPDEEHRKKEVAWVIKYGQFEREQRYELDEWKRTWQCLDCGHRWLPKK